MNRIGNMCVGGDVGGTLCYLRLKDNNRHGDTAKGYIIIIIVAFAAD